MARWGGRKAFFAAVGIILLAGLVQASIYGSQDHTVHLSSADVQMVVDQVVGRTTHGVKLEAAKVTLHNDHATIDAVVSGRKLGKAYLLPVSATGIPDFEHSKGGDFYFMPINVEVGEVTFDGKSPTEIIQGFAQRHLGKHEGLQKTVMEVAPHAENWIKESAQVGAKLVFTEIPVVRLKDKGVGWFMRASVKNVKIYGDDLAIQFTLWQFTKTVLIGTAGVVLALLVTFAFFFVVG